MVSPRPSGPRVHLALLGFLALAAALFIARPVMAQTDCDRAGCGTVRGPSIPKRRLEFGRLCARSRSAQGYRCRRYTR